MRSGSPSDFSMDTLTCKPSMLATQPVSIELGTRRDTLSEPFTNTAPLVSRFTTSTGGVTAEVFGTVPPLAGTSGAGVGVGGITAVARERVSV